MTYTIGQFAALAGVTAKTLRFYDEIGLLSPASVDVLTRYRRYRPEQLPRLAAILSLRELGLPLSEIQALMRRGDRTRDRRAVLERTRDQLTASLEQARRSLAWVNAELADLADAEQPVPIVVRKSPALSIASLRTEIESYGQIDEIERKLREAVPESARGLRAGVIWHRCADAGAPDGEAFVELKAPLPPRSPLRASVLPAATVACAYTDGGDASTQDAYAALSRWTRVRSYRVSAAPRELYHARMLEVQLCVEPEA